MATKTIVRQNGDEWVIKPMGRSLVGNVARRFEKSGQKVSLTDATISTSIEFNLELAKAATVAWRIKLGDGSFREASATEVGLLFNENDGAADFVLQQAKRFAEEVAAEYEADLKN